VNISQNSRTVESSQRDVHPRLGDVLDAHLRHGWQAPLHAPSVRAFNTLQAQIVGESRPLVLDSGCGTGESTRLMAKAMPDCLVIGVDKSQARLARTGGQQFPHREGNAIWLRADLTTFWRLALGAGWRLRKHFLLYPNPWPKPRQMRRRWHGHPVFPQLLALGGDLEMRCNWLPYALEFAAASRRALGVRTVPRVLGDSTITTPFERKYRASGHSLYSVSVSCDASGV
jgi:tRNA G46 methylase TrmB